MRRSTHKEIVRRRSVFDILNPRVNVKDINRTKLQLLWVAPMLLEVESVVAALRARKRIHVMCLRSHEGMAVPASHFRMFREDVGRCAPRLDLNTHYIGIIRTCYPEDDTGERRTLPTFGWESSDRVLNRDPLLNQPG